MAEGTRCFPYRKDLIVAKGWHSFGKTVAQIWQKNDNDLAETLCYNSIVRNWDFERSPSFLLFHPKRSVSK